MDLQVIKMKVDISGTPRETLSPVPIITPKAETKGEDWENLFQNVLL